jgi:hypothetical protein
VSACFSARVLLLFTAQTLAFLQANSCQHPMLGPLLQSISQHCVTQSTVRSCTVSGHLQKRHTALQKQSGKQCPVDVPHNTHPVIAAAAAALQVCLLWASSQGPLGPCCKCAMHDYEESAPYLTVNAPCTCECTMHNCECCECTMHNYSWHSSRHAGMTVAGVTCLFMLRVRHTPVLHNRNIYMRYARWAHHSRCTFADQMYRCAVCLLLLKVSCMHCLDPIM